MLDHFLEVTAPLQEIVGHIIPAETTNCLIVK